MVRFFIYLTAFSFLSAICKAEISTYYQLNLTDWPSEIILSLENEVHEIKDNQLTAEKLNLLLKKLDTTFRFNSLKLIAGSKPFELRLVGEISTQIESIEFQGLSDLSEGEALLLMNLSTKTAIEEDYVKTALEKLIQYYQEQGYRFATTNYQYQNLSTFKRKLVIQINTKKQTKIAEINVENLDSKTQNFINHRLNVTFKNDVLNQITLGKLATKLRQHLSEYGYYLAAVPPAQLIFSADELKARAQFKIDPKQRYDVEIVNALEFSKSYLEDDVLKLGSYFSADSNFGSDLSEN